MNYMKRFGKEKTQKTIGNQRPDRMLARRVLAAVTAVSVVGQPFASLAASVVTRVDTPDKNLMQGQNVGHIYAEKVVNNGNIAVNRFDKFQIGAGNIANMYFQTQPENQWAGSLVNFVNSRIDVAGTVNAIKNNKIDGNLFFLSSNGMAVSNTGVINAGSLFVMTPTQDFMKGILGDDLKGFNEGNFNAQWDNISSMQIPINASGTIVVEGKIHTTDGIGMKAANIRIGSEENAKDNTALLETGVVNFNSLVNTTGENGEAISAGLTGDLTAEMTESGDIVLAAIATERNEKDSSFNSSTTGNNLVHASIISNGTVSAAGDVDITAIASSGEAYDKYFTDESGETANEVDVWGQIVKTKADITINGTVTGQHVNAAAESHNSFITAGLTKPDLGDINGLLGVVGFNIDGGYAVLGGEASVDVGKSASITAKAADTDTKKALSLTADSVVRAAAGASTSAIKLANVKHLGNVPSAGVVYAKTENDASVTISGSVTAEKGSMDIAADAETRLEAVASDNTTKIGGNVNDTTRINAAVAIADGSNTSSVDIQNTATVSVAGNLDISASGINSVNTQALVKGKESALAATAVNVTNYDSSADVNVGTNLKGSNVSVTAGNTVLENTVIANGNIGSGSLVTAATDEAVNSQTVQTIKGVFTNLKDRIYKSEDTVGTWFDNFSDLVSIGASVGVAEESFKSGVHIGNGVNVSAVDASGKKGNINVAANTIIKDTHMQVAGVSNNYTDENDKKEVLINAGVLYVDMDSEANVTIEGGSGDAYTGLDGKNVTVAAHSEFQYDRIDKMIDELLLLCDKLEGAYASNETYKANVENLAKLAEEYKANIAKDPNYADSTKGNEAAMALAAAAQQVSNDAQDPSVLNQIKDIVTGPFSVAGAAAQFADPGNYANFQASGGTSGDKNASVGIAGSVNINKLSNTASVLVGKNVKITAEDKADVDAQVVQKDVSITGRVGLNGGTETTAGGSVGVHMGQTDSLVAVAEGAAIRGSSVALGADNDVTHTGIVINAGKGGTNGLSGMVGYMEGDSSAVVSVDDEASLTAAANGAGDKDEDGLVSIDAGNTTVITNIAGGAAIGKQAGIGASAGITDYTVNTVAAVADNDADAKRGEEEPVSGLIGMVHRGLTAGEKSALFGTTENTLTGAGITAEDFKVHAVNDSVINTVTIAGGVTTGDDSDEPGVFDEIGNFIDNKGNLIHNGFNTIDSKFAGALPDKLKELAGTVNDPGKRPTNMQATNANMGADLPSLSISGAGSASVNLVSGSTAALVENANIHLTKADSTVQAGAEDDGFIGAWSGAGAISWKQAITEPNMNNTNVGLAGAVGVNVTATDVVSRIAGSSIAGAASITNTAKKSGALVAAGLGLAAAKAGQGGGKSYDGAASVSVNVSDNMVSAFMEDNKVNEDNQDGPATVLTNGAYDSDTQVTGGVNFSLVAGGERGVAVGGTVGYSELTNNVSSVISGGTYRNMGTMDVHALSDITQVGAAVGVSVSGSSGTNIGFNGVAAYNQLNNAVAAGIENAEIHAAAVGVRAQDTDLGEKKYDKYLKDRGIDANGSSYIANVNDTTKDLENPGTTGNTIVTGALGISGAAGSKGGAGAAAISISDINNDFDAHITGGSIFASGSGSEKVPDVNVYAKSDTLLVGVAAGGAGTGGNISGVGSLTWQTLDNDTIATIENTTIHADNTAVRALNGSLGVNVAGQLGVGNMAVGLALAYNNLENTTGAYLKGASVDRYETGEGSASGSASLIVDSQNNSKLYAIGAGVSAVTGNLAANGTIAINIGRNNTEAIVDEADGNRAKLNHISALSVTTNDQSSELALAGGVGVSTAVAVGGAVAYNEIGNISGSNGEKKQQNAAKINHADITAEDGASIDVSAKDASGLTTAAVGIGIAATGEGVSVAVQGAAATVLINKNTEASMDGTVISRGSGAENGADVSVSAESKNSIATTADVASVSSGETSVSVGAGVAVNRSEADVRSSVAGGAMDVKNLRLDAVNRADITTIGVGASVALGMGAGVTGSVAVNQIGNTTAAGISGGADIVASDNVIVAASGDESIANYAGSLSAAAQGAAVGLSVSVNQIDSETRAFIEGDTTKVSAAGNGEKEYIDDQVDDSAILDKVVDDETFDSTASLADSRKNSGYSGVAVSASSTHTMKSFLVNGGVAGEGAAVNGTVNVNQIGGGTSAVIKGADINAGTATAGDVHVTAHDYANSAGLVGTASIAGIGAGVGLGSDTNTVSRDVSAEILGKGEAGAGGAYSGKNTVNASALGVDAEAKQGIASLTAGISVGGVGAGVSNATSVALLEGTTAARINGAGITAHSAAVEANHTGKLNTMGVAVGAGGVGAGVGIGVSVLNENSETDAEVANASMDITDTGDVAVRADNSTKVNYQLYNMGGAVAGVAGSVGVSNVASQVNASVLHSQIGMDSQAGNVTIAGSNSIDFTNKAGTGSAGAVGIGVGVAVNTIDSQVRTRVEDTDIRASGDIKATAEETRTVDQLAVNASAGGVGAGANVMITNIGKEVDGAYGENLQTDENGNVTGKDGMDVNAVYMQAEEAINGNRLSSGYTLGVLSDDEVNQMPEATAGTGAAAEEDKSMVKVTIDGAHLQAGNAVTAESKETTNVAINGVNASVGAGASASGAVGILNVHRNSGVEMTSTTVNAGRFTAHALQTGNSNLNIYQGTLSGGLSIGAAYASASTEGKTGVGIGSSQITVRDDAEISAEDTGKMTVNAIGVAASAGGAASVIVAEGTNRGETTATIDKTEVNAGGDILIDVSRKANEGDSLAVSAIAGSGGLVFAGAGVSAIANEYGTVGAEITGGSRFNAGNTIRVSALNAPSVKASTGAVSASLLFGSAAVTVAEANLGSEKEHLQTKVVIDDTNTFEADTMTAEAKADASQTVDMSALSITASPFSASATAQVNTGGAAAYSDVKVDIGESVFKGHASDGMDLTVNGSNTVNQNVKAYGISVGTTMATGTNLADTLAHLSTQVTASGNANSRLDDVNMSGRSFATVTNEADGHGGALIDISPYAAKVENDYTADTDVTIKGTWNAAGDVTAQALNGMDIDLVSDAVRAAIVGGSGTWLDNTINNAANVTLDGAQITSGGAQSYTAQNQVDYTGEINGSGYGGINVNATDYKDDLDFTAGVDIKGSTLESTGDDGGITAFASTEGTIHSKNSLKSAGVIPIALAFSDHAVDYHNSVNVTDSMLTTDKAGSDITLAATDDMDVKLETIADTQGGVVGAASAEAANTLNRSNKITVGEGSRLHSTNDVNLYGGADTDGIASSLDLQVLADAYNKTAVPLATNPSVDNQMTQSNQVELGGTAESVRHINVSAGRGTTSVTTSAQEYKVWTGTGGKGEVASTAFGDTIRDEKTDNAFKLTGTGSATAGIHNKLNIEISGQTTTKDPTYNADGTEMVTPGSISYDGIQVNVTDGADWFKPEDNVTMTDMPLENGLMERYNEVMGYLNAYDKNSDAYRAYDAERQLLLQEMLNTGLAEETKGPNGESIITPLSNASTPAIELSDIVVSGGNINISADNLTGDAGTKLIAQGAPQLTITNSSDLYLKVNDLTISDNGGSINMAGVNADGFKGNKTSSTEDGSTPTITIHGATNDSSAFGADKHVQADIGIFGDITNSAGNIDITSDNYNIFIEGNVNGRNIAIKAAKGDVTQTNPEGLINIGKDPIANIQFSEDVAKKIQTYLYGKKESGTQSFANYGDYLYWLIHTVGITAEELGLDADSGSLSAEALNQKFAPQNGDNDKNSVILAGGNVYISGLNVNIAGLVQSGYGDYGTTLTADAQKKVEAIDSKWQTNRTPLSDADVIGNSEYLVNEGGEVWNETTKVWDYEVKVYYNPATGQLLTESVRPDGGQIQINGKISSTGGGRIMAMDGTADIHIDTTAVDKDVKVNSITNSDISGLITITDKNKTNADGDYQVTEYRNGAYRTYWTGDDTAGIGWTTTDDELTYKPEEGTQFAWTGGVTGERQEEYSYTEDFLFWGALAYNKSEDLLNHIAQVGAKPTPGPVTSGGNPESMANGSLVTDGYSGGDNMLTISWDYSKKDNMTATDPDVEKKYDGTAGKIFGYGEYIYTWIQKQGDQIASSSGLKADETIHIGFLGNGNGSGNIEVNTAGDMLLNGAISNAAIVDENSHIAGKGSVSLTSTGGSISAVGNAAINSDDVNLKAKGDITVNHAAIGTGATINAVSDTGSIAFTSTKGDITIEQALAGGNGAITAETGDVSIEAAGSILDGHTSGDYAVKGQRIDLVSTGGSIGTKDKALTLLAGSDLYSSDTMASSVNAQAAGDIVLTQTDGNMRLGTIVSENGDAVLTVTNGSFVDAHPSENSSSSTAEDKIDRWLGAGLISEADDANSSAKAAEEAEALRVGALEERMNSLAAAGAHTVDEYKAAAEAFSSDEAMQAAKTTYLNAVAGANGDSDKINAAYAAYKEAQSQYFADKGFSADEQAAITSYAEVKNSDNYGWSKNQLLYAIQDSVLNATPGEVTTVETPNVSAQNITLHAASGGIGIDGEAQIISYDALNSEENLKLLANAKAGDLTWDNKSQTVTIRQQQAITVDVADGGVVDVIGKDNVYLAGVKDTKLDVNDIETDGDIRLQGDAGVVVDSLKGQDLTIAGGSGSIMSSHNEGGYVTTNLSGSIDANATGDISFSDLGDMEILTIASDGAVNLKAAGSILMKDVENSQAQGYINAGTVLNLEAVSSIGDSSKALRVLDNGVVVNAAAGGAIYLSGVSGQESTDSLVLGTIKGASLNVDSVSNVSLGRANDSATDEDESVTGRITTTEGDASITAANVDLADGTVNVGMNNFNVTANAGDITQSAASAGLTANHVNLTSTGSQRLLSENNQINSVTVRGLVDDSLTGGVEIHNAAENFAVQFGDAAGGVTVHDGGIDIRYTGSGMLTVNGSAATEATGESANADIAFTSQTGGITVAGNMTAGDAFSAVTTSGPVTIEGSVIAQEDVMATTGSGSIAFGGSVTAETGQIMADTEKGDIEVNGAATAGTDIKLESGAGTITVTGDAAAGSNFSATTTSGDVTVSGNVSAKDNVTASTESGNVTLGEMNEFGEATGNVKAESGSVTVLTNSGFVMVNGTVSSGTDTKFHAGGTEGAAGDITVNGGVTAKDNVTADTTFGSIAFNGTTTAGTGILLKSDEGNISTAGAATAATGDVTAETGSGSIAFGGDVTAVTGNITADTKAGEITVNGTANAGMDIGLTSGAGTITVTGSATAQNTFLADTGSGDITLKGQVTAVNGNASASTTTGDILVDGAVKSGGDTTLTTSTTDEGKGHVTVEGSIEAGDNVTVTTNHGDVTLGAEGSDDKVSALGGAVMVTTNSGDITVNGSTDAAKNISLTSTHDGDITVNGTADAGTDIGLTSGSGAIATTGSLTAAQNVSAETGNGAITLGGDVTATAGNVIANTQAGDIAVNGTTHAGIDIGLTSGSGAITTTGSLTAAQNVLAETGAGNIQLGGSVTAAAGNIAADSGSGDITFSDTATAGQHVSAETENGSIAFGGTTTANAGNVTASVTGEGNVTFGGAVNAHGTAETAGSIHATVAAGNITAEEGAALTADRDVHLQTQNGDITFNEVVNAGKDLFAQAVHSGSILVRDDLTAGQDITLNTNIGDILFEGKTDDVHEKIHVTSNQGDVLLKVEEGGHGDIRDTNREANGDHAVIHAALGNVTTENGGIEAGGDDSDIDLYEVYAKEDSKISTAEGDLHLVNVSGNLVAVVVRKPGKQMESEHVEAATEIQIAGSNMDLDDIVQREDGDGFLTITPDGVDDNTPIDNLVIGDIRTNGGVRFNRLWLNTGDIHVSSGAFHLDKLYVEDKATFSTPHMTTDVFGSAPVYDDTRDSAYWINTDINRPNSDLNAWKADGTHGQWMYLHFDADSPVQHSNGNLLHLQDHNDTYSQRYSMTDWMNIFSDKDFYRFYDRYYAPELSYHDRYGLIDGAGVSADNAESDEITVE